MASPATGRRQDGRSFTTELLCLPMQARSKTLSRTTAGSHSGATQCSKRAIITRRRTKLSESVLPLCLCSPLNTSAGLRRSSEAADRRREGQRCRSGSRSRRRPRFAGRLRAPSARGWRRLLHGRCLSDEPSRRLGYAIRKVERGRGRYDEANQGVVERGASRSSRGRGR